VQAHAEATDMASDLAGDRGVVSIQRMSIGNSGLLLPRLRALAGSFRQDLPVPGIQSE